MNDSSFSGYFGLSTIDIALPLTVSITIAAQVGPTHGGIIIAAIR